MGIKDGSVWVTTSTGTYLNVFKAFRMGKKPRVRGKIEAEMGAGVARITCEKGPKVVLSE